MNMYSKITKESIDEIAKHFMGNPWDYYTEPDLHVQLYWALRQKLVKESILCTQSKDGENVNILYREFPTNKQYAWVGKNKRRANFDLAILDPKTIATISKPKSKEMFKGLRACVGIEVKLDVTDKSWKNEMGKCFDKLNEIKEPMGRFIIFFARRQKFRYYDEFCKWIKKKNNEIQVKYVRVHPKKWKEDEPENIWL